MPKKRTNPKSLQVYFPTDLGKKIQKRLDAVAKASGLSVSKVASMAIMAGLETVEANLLVTIAKPNLQEVRKKA